MQSHFKIYLSFFNHTSDLVTELFNGKLYNGEYHNDDDDLVA